MGAFTEVRGFMERLLRRYPRTTLLQELHITNYHATIDCFAHVINGKQGDLDCYEKLTQNYDLRKGKTNLTQTSILKIMLVRTALG